jgi:hypothetical protein
MTISQTVEAAACHAIAFAKAGVSRESFADFESNMNIVTEPKPKSIYKTSSSALPASQTLASTTGTAIIKNGKITKPVRKNECQRF